MRDKMSLSSPLTLTAAPCGALQLWGEGRHRAGGWRCGTKQAMHKRNWRIQKRKDDNFN
jgi:hypothetical protein